MICFMAYKRPLEGETLLLPKVVLYQHMPCTHCLNRTNPMPNPHQSIRMSKLCTLWFVTCGSLQLLAHFDCIAYSHPVSADDTLFYMVSTSLDSTPTCCLTLHLPRFVHPVPPLPIAREPNTSNLCHRYHSILLSPSRYPKPGTGHSYNIQRATTDNSATQPANTAREHKVVYKLLRPY